MSKKPKIRVLALGLIRDGDRLLVHQAYDSVKQDFFYRVLGGGVDFGETSRQALEREFQEEIQADLINIRYLGCLENLFVYNGQPGHELIQLYQCDFADSKFYQIKQFNITEGDRQETAIWVDISCFKSGELRLVPEAFFDFI